MIDFKTIKSNELVLVLNPICYALLKDYVETEMSYYVSGCTFIEESFDEDTLVLRGTVDMESVDYSNLKIERPTGGQIGIYSQGYFLEIYFGTDFKTISNSIGNMTSGSHEDYNYDGTDLYYLSEDTLTFVGDEFVCFGQNWRYCLRYNIYAKELIYNMVEGTWMFGSGAQSVYFAEFAKEDLENLPIANPASSITSKIKWIYGKQRGKSTMEYDSCYSIYKAILDKVKEQVNYVPSVDYGKVADNEVVVGCNFDLTDITDEVILNMFGIMPTSWKYENRVLNAYFDMDSIDYDTFGFFRGVSVISQFNYIIFGKSFNKITTGFFGRNFTKESVCVFLNDTEIEIESGILNITTNSYFKHLYIYSKSIKDSTDGNYVFSSFVSSGMLPYVHLAINKEEDTIKWYRGSNKNYVIKYGLTMGYSTMEYDSCYSIVKEWLYVLDSSTLENKYDSLYSILKDLLVALGGRDKKYDCVYDILLGIGELYSIEDKAYDSEYSILLAILGNIDNPPTPLKPDYLKFTAVEDGSHLGYNKSTVANAYFSYDKDTWQDLSVNGVDLDSGESVYVKGEISGNQSASDYSYFVTTGSFNVEGDIMSMYGETEDDSVIDYKYAFSSLFQNTTVLDASKLILSPTTLSEGCYRNMFTGSSLTKAPRDLPALVVSGRAYSNMFQGTSIETAPFISATSLDGTRNMYQMFDDCNLLKNVQEELYPTVLTTSCYSGMYSGCTSLEKAPILPANDFTSANLAYANMFNGCSNLTSVTHHITYWNTTNASYWLEGVAASGTVTCPAATIIPTGESGIPENWTRVDI